MIRIYRGPRVGWGGVEAVVAALPWVVEQRIGVRGWTVGKVLPQGPFRLDQTVEGELWKPVLSG